MIEVHAYIEVTELQQGIDFYTRGLGLTLRRRLGPRWVEMSGANIPIYLLAERPSEAVLGGKSFRRSYRRHWTPVHLDFIVTDLESSLERAQEAGAVLERDIQTETWGRMANLADPFGHGIDLIELAPGGYDNVEQSPNI